MEKGGKAEGQKGGMAVLNKKDRAFKSPCLELSSNFILFSLPHR